MIARIVGTASNIASIVLNEYARPLATEYWNAMSGKLDASAISLK
ncbi:hypothetical protein [Paraburkholderia sp. BR10954]